MNSKYFFIVVTICFIVFPLTNSSAQSLKIGSAAPLFKIESGENEVLSLDMIRGKTIFIFYETKDVVEKNRLLKNRLNTFYDAQPENVKKSIVRLPVIDCSSAFWPLIGIWKSKLVENSKKEGITIYGDWDGKMKSAYMMKNNESNIVIIDKEGLIKYFAFGKISEEEIIEIIGLLKKLGY
ncbi:MAG: YtfJ family protein [Endomicrobiia bacterium]